jgi:hypothetical protein
LEPGHRREFKKFDGLLQDGDDQGSIAHASSSSTARRSSSSQTMPC